MASTNDLKEKLAEIVKKQNKIKRDQEQVAFQKQKKLDDAAADAARYEKHGKTGRGNERVDNWEVVVSKAENMIKDGAESYRDWRSIMIEMMASFATIARAIDYEIGEFRRALPDTYVGRLASAPAIVISDKFKAWCARNPELPNLSYAVNFKEGKVDIASLEADSGVELNGKLDEFFNDGISMWLENEGYKENPEEKRQFIHEASGKLLTEETFNELKNDPDKGLRAWLSDEYTLNFDEKPTMSP